MYVGKSFFTNGKIWFSTDNFINVLFLRGHKIYYSSAKKFTLTIDDHVF